MRSPTAINLVYRISRKTSAPQIYAICMPLFSDRSDTFMAEQFHGSGRPAVRVGSGQDFVNVGSKILEI